MVKDTRKEIKELRNFAIALSAAAGIWGLIFFIAAKHSYPYFFLVSATLLFFGLALPGGKDFSGFISWYRWHIPDPVRFERSIRVSIEHGHANRRSDDYSSTAYWYQVEPHKPFGILPVLARLPRADFPEIKE